MGKYRKGQGRRPAIVSTNSMFWYLFDPKYNKIRVICCKGIPRHLMLLLAKDICSYINQEHETLITESSALLSYFEMNINWVSPLLIMCCNISNGITVALGTKFGLTNINTILIPFMTGSLSVMTVGQFHTHCYMLESQQTKCFLSWLGSSQCWCYYLFRGYHKTITLVKWNWCATTMKTF